MRYGVGTEEPRRRVEWLNTQGEWPISRNRIKVISRERLLSSWLRPAPGLRSQRFACNRGAGNSQRVKPALRPGSGAFRFGSEAELSPAMAEVEPEPDDGNHGLQSELPHLSALLNWQGCRDWSRNLRIEFFARTAVHPLRPDVKSAARGRWNFPRSPDAGAFTKATVENVVRAGVGFNPLAFPRRGVVAARDDKMPHAVAAHAAHSSLREIEMQVHAMTILRPGVVVKTGPRSGRKQIIFHVRVVGMREWLVKDGMAENGRFS